MQTDYALKRGCIAPILVRGEKVRAGMVWYALELRTLPVRKLQLLSLALLGQLC